MPDPAVRGGLLLQSAAPARLARGAGQKNNRPSHIRSVGVEGTIYMTDDCSPLRHQYMPITVRMSTKMYAKKPCTVFRGISDPSNVPERKIFIREKAADARHETAAILYGLQGPEMRQTPLFL